MKKRRTIISNEVPEGTTMPDKNWINNLEMKDLKQTEYQYIMGKLKVIVCSDCYSDISEGQEVQLTCGDTVCAECAKDHPCI